MAEVILSPSEYSYGSPGEKSLSDWAAVVKEEEAKSVSLLGPITLGLLTLIVGVGGFVFWALSTELSSAAVASGRVVVETSTKTVSRLESGTLKAVLVHEGQKVKVGDILATLDVTRSQSNLQQLRQQLFSGQAQLARLTGERDQKPAFVFDLTPPEGMDPVAAANVVSTEKRLFQERTNLYRDQISADQSSVDQLASQRDALDARMNAWKEQIEVVRREYDTYVKLQARKLITVAMLNDKKLQIVGLEGSMAETRASLAENAQRKTQAELNATGRRNDYFRGVSVEIQQTQNNIANTHQEIISAQDVVSKAEIRSPQDGVVANIQMKTPGSAVISGMALLDIVPDNRPLLIEGAALPQDIDQMRVGQKTEIKLSAFGAAELLPLIGHVTYIAPDSIVDPRTGETKFPFKAKIDEAELKKQPNLFLYPGMSAEVYIVTGNRSAMAYLAEPIRRSFNKAFREQ